MNISWRKCRVVSFAEIFLWKSGFYISLEETTRHYLVENLRKNGTQTK